MPKLTSAPAVLAGVFALSLGQPLSDTPAQLLVVILCSGWIAGSVGSLMRSGWRRTVRLIRVYSA